MAGRHGLPLAWLVPCRPLAPLLLMQPAQEVAPRLLQAKKTRLAALACWGWQRT